MNTKFHDLCLDIILEILRYFNIHEIFYSFCLLIPCLPTLLVNGRVQLHVRSNNSYFIRWILPHIKLSQVVSLHVPTRPYNPSIFQFSALRSLVLTDVDDPLLLLEQSNTWPPCYLEHLSLHIRNQDLPNKPSNIGTRVLERVLQFPRLKHFELHESKLSLKMVELFDEFIFPMTFHSSNIQCLIITVYCHWQILQSILNSSPKLNHFQIHSSFSQSENLSSQLYFPLIRKLNLRLDGLQADRLIEIFHHASCLRQCQLKSFVSSYKQNHTNLLENQTWIQLFEIYTPQLNLLDVDIRFRLENINEKFIEMINEDLRSLNFQINENENHYWKLTGIFIRQS